jgi:hypothetical protein
VIAIGFDDTVVFAADIGGFLGLLAAVAVVVAIVTQLVLVVRMRRALNRIGDRMDDMTLEILDAIDAATNDEALAIDLVASKLTGLADELAAARAAGAQPDPQIAARLQAHATALQANAARLKTLAADPANPVPAPVPPATPTEPAAVA